MKTITLQLEDIDYDIIQKTLSQFQALHHKAGLQKSITDNYSGNMAAKIITHLCVSWQETHADEVEDLEGEDWKNASSPT